MHFSNFAYAKLKVDETFIIDNRIARKKKNSYAGAVRYDNISTCANTTDLSKIYCELSECQKSNSSNSGTCPPDLCTNSTEVSSSSNSQISQNEANVFSSQDEELLSILQDLQHNFSSETESSSKLIGGYFCSDTVFNLTSKVMTDTEMNILEKRLKILLLFRIKLINQNWEKTLKSSVVDWELSGTFAVIFQNTLVRSLRLHLSPNGSHLRVILASKSS